MKRRFAYSIDDKRIEFKQRKIKEEYFNGIVCYLKYVNVEKPLIVNNGREEICLYNNNYEWLELYPSNSNYVITIMFDDNKNLIEWYFDISKNVGVENGIPYEDDLYLDFIITPNGEGIVIDEDELQNALDKNDITNDDYEFAYKVLRELQNKYLSDFNSLKDLTEILYNSFSDEKKKL